MAAMAVSRAHVIALVVLAALAAGCSTAQQTTSGQSQSPSSASPTASVGESTSPFTGSFDVNGHDLYLSCTGSGEPTIVLEPGEGGSSTTLDAIRSEYDARVMVCGYDRANVGNSGAAPTPRNSDEVTADLHDLLRDAEVPGPYILVGHSAGGLIVQAYAARYPEEVAGVVAMNPVPPWQEWSKEGLAAMTPAERKGEGAYYKGENGESFDYKGMSERIAALPIPKVPFHLLISTIAQCDSPNDVCSRTYPAYTHIMNSVADRWANGRFSQVPASHDIYLDKIRTVRGVIDEVLARAA
jgi:pimeloyl-ACP methyl ester carboxylesterase